MKSFVLSFVIGAIVGGFYGAIHVRSPAPPLVALARKMAHFHSLAGMARAVEQVLIAHGVTLHTGRSSSRYLAGRGGIRP